MVDGFKPGQRKILFSCFKRKLKEEIKVAQLAGYAHLRGCDRSDALVEGAGLKAFACLLDSGPM